MREADKLEAVVIVLEGKALNWLLWWEEQSPAPSWDEFKTAVIRRFHSGTFQMPLGPLLSLKQEETMMEYREEFELHMASL